MVHPAAHNVLVYSVLATNIFVSFCIFGKNSFSYKNERPCTVWAPKVGLGKTKQHSMFFFIFYNFLSWFNIFSWLVVIKLLSSCSVLYCFCILSEVFTFQTALRSWQKNPDNSCEFTPEKFVSSCILLQFFRWSIFRKLGAWVMLVSFSLQNGPILPSFHILSKLTVLPPNIFVSICIFGMVLCHWFVV